MCAWHQDLRLQEADPQTDRDIALRCVVCVTMTGTGCSDSSNLPPKLQTRSQMSEIAIRDDDGMHSRASRDEQMRRHGAGNVENEGTVRVCLDRRLQATA